MAKVKKMQDDRLIRFGNIKSYSNFHGYGFIIGNDGQERYFHISGVKENSVNRIKPGAFCSWEIEAKGKKGDLNNALAIFIYKDLLK